MGASASLWEKVALRDAGPQELGGDGDFLPVDWVVPTETADGLATVPTGARVLSARALGDEWSFASWRVLATEAAGPGLRIVSTEPHVTGLGAYGMVGVFATPILLYEAWAKGRLPVGIPRTVHVHVNGPVPPTVGPTDLVLNLIAEIGFDGLSGSVLEFRGDAVEGMPAFQREELLAAAALTGCLTALAPLSESALEEVRRAGLRASMPISDFQRYRPDEEAVYRELYVLNGDAVRPYLAWPRRALVETMRNHEGKKLDRVILGGCVGGGMAAMEFLADALADTPVDGSVKFYVVPASHALHEQAKAKGLVNRLLVTGAKVVTPWEVPRATGSGLTLTNSACWDPEAALASIPTILSSANSGRLMVPGGRWR